MKAISQTAFTLVELMVAIVILSVIAAAVLLTNVKSLQSYYTLSALDQLSNNAWLGLNELAEELRESKASTVGTALLLDPTDLRWHNILIFASARGNPVLGNGDFHIDANGQPDLESAVAYYTFTTPEGISQLRRYVFYNSNLTESDFPMNAVITQSDISLIRPNGTPLGTINRATGAERILINHISTEDQNTNFVLDANENDTQALLPMDNGDGQLDTGIDYAVGGNTISIKLFLQKTVSEIAGGVGRRVAVTLSSAVTLRN